MPESQSPKEISGIRRGVGAFFLGSHRMHYAALALIVLLGAGLRLINIQAEPYWGDEVLSLDIATYVHPIGQLLAYIRAIEFHPPLYYIILQTWTHWFGTEPGATRSLSLIFGLAIVILGYFFVRTLWQNRRAALIAALVLALLPAQIKFSQTARPYTIMVFLGLVAAYALWRHLRTRSWKFLGLYIVAGILGLYIHYSFLFILAALGLWWGIELLVFEDFKRPRAFIIWLGAHAIILAGFSYWLSAFFYKILLGQFPIEGLSRSTVSLRTLAFFETGFDQLIWSTTHSAIALTPIFVAWIWKLTTLGLLVLWLVKQGSALSSSDRRGVYFLLWLVLLPASLFLFAPQSVAYTPFPWQHLLFITVPLAGLIAGFAVRISARRASAFLVIFLLSLVPFIVGVVGNDADWDPEYQLKGYGEQISQQYKPGDIVIIPYAIARTDFSHFLSDDIPIVSILPLNYNGDDIWRTRHTLGLIENEYQTRVKSPSVGEARERLTDIAARYKPKRVWLLGFTSRDDYIHQWFLTRDWHKGFSSIEDIYLLDLYARDASTK